MQILDTSCAAEAGAGQWSAAHEGRPDRLIATFTELALRKKQIAWITFSFMAVGLILCFVLPKRYRGQAVIMTPQQVPSLSTLVEAEGLGGLGSLAQAASGGLGLKDPNLEFIGMLQSRSIADAIIDQFHLMAIYRAADMTAARKTLDWRTDIKAEKSNLVSIAVTDSDPQRAANMANAYVEQLRRLTREMSSKEDARRREYFEDQLSKQREALIRSELSLLDVQREKGVVQPAGQAAAVLGEMTELRAEIAAQRVEVQTLRSFSTEKNPDVQLAENQLETLEQEASRLSQHGSSDDYGDLGLKDVPVAGLEYLRAERDMAFQLTLYSVLLKQYEAFRLDESNEAYSIEVVDQALVPDRRSFPKRSILMAIATLLGLASSYGWIQFEKRWRAWVSAVEFNDALTSLVRALRIR